MQDSIEQRQPGTAVVHFLLEDMEVEVPLGTRFPDIVQSSGADVTFGCLNGTCGTCRVRIENGMQNLSSKNREEKDFLESIEAESSERLGCQLCVNGDCAIDYIGV